MSMAGGDLTIEILKDIREDIRGVRSGVHDVRAEVHDLRSEVHDLRADTNKRFALVEAAILDLAEQHRFVVRYTKAIADRDGQLEPRVSALESRVDKLETK
jgi:polyhydroxyalkanoate synthesis regulator phasin